MWDFSGDEFLFFFAAGAVGTVGLIRWYWRLLRVAPVGAPRWPRRILALVPAAALAFMAVVIWNWADPVHVAGHVDYTTLFMAGGAAWLTVAAACMPLLGVSPRDDALERRNLPAAVATAGALLGVSFAYAQSNIGNGPTIWTTLVPALVATAALFAAWAVVELVGGDVAEAITVDRDPASAVRLAAFLAAAGAVLGRAMAGDFVDWPTTFLDFVRTGWPVALLVLLAVVFHRACRPTPERPRPSTVAYGIIPGALLLLAAAGYLLYLGAPHVAPAPPPAGPQPGPVEAG